MKEKHLTMPEPYVYSAGCFWHGPISEVGKTKPVESGITVPGVGKLTPHSLPCCPHCGSMLFQVESKEVWDKGAREHEAKGHTNYVALLEWSRVQGRCWPSLREAAVDFKRETGKEVIFDL